MSIILIGHLSRHRAVPDNGGLIEYGVVIDNEKPIYVDELEGHINDDWELGCLPEIF